MTTANHVHAPRGPAMRGVSALLSLSVLFAAGCAPQIRWRVGFFDQVFAEAQRDDKLTFVYLRDWYIPECTEFENGVLQDARVLAATAELYCVELSYFWSEPLVKEWGVGQPPAVVILDPDRNVLAKLSREIPLDDLVAAIGWARAVFAPATQPATAPLGP